MCTDPAKYSRRIKLIIAFDREAANHLKPNPVEQLIFEFAEVRPKRLERKSFRRDLTDVPIQG